MQRNIGDEYYPRLQPLESLTKRWPYSAIFEQAQKSAQWMWTWRRVIQLLGQLDTRSQLIAVDPVHCVNYQPRYHSKQTQAYLLGFARLVTRDDHLTVLAALSAIKCDRGRHLLAQFAGSGSMHIPQVNQRFLAILADPRLLAQLSHVARHLDDDDDDEEEDEQLHKQLASILQCDHYERLVGILAEHYSFLYPQPLLQENIEKNSAEMNCASVVATPKEQYFNPPSLSYLGAKNLVSNIEKIGLFRRPDLTEPEMAVGDFDHQKIPMPAYKTSHSV